VGVVGAGALVGFLAWIAIPIGGPFLSQPRDCDAGVLEQLKGALSPLSGLRKDQSTEAAVRLLESAKTQIDLLPAVGRRCGCVAMWFGIPRTDY